MVVGDFNAHVDNPENPGGTELLELLDSMALQQHVSGATHVGGHTLDLIISRECDDTIRPGSVTISDMVSDHSSVHCVLDLEPPLPVKRICKYRRLAAIDRAAFREDLRALPLLVDPEKDISALVDQYCHDLTAAADKHAPEKSRVLCVRPHVPWYTEEIAEAKRKRRRYEQLWRESQLTVHRQMFTSQRQLVKDLILTSKRKFFASAIREAPSPHALFGVVDRLLHRKKPTPLPEHRSAQQLANRFCNFFHKKIVDIRTHLDDLVVPSMPDVPIKPRRSDLTQFVPTTPEELLKIIRRSPAKSCGLDPMPTSLLVEHADALLPAITEIVNLSLTSGEFPAQLKIAHVIPLLKKSSLNPEDLRNFRPVSNLHFLSKLVEKAAYVQVSNHLQENGLYESCQSAYRASHSTETALLRIQSDCLLALDRKESVFLVLLDLSSAFDTIDHTLLLETLETRFGICEQALSWFRSYLTDRFQAVRIDGHLSHKQRLDCGVPQGSVLGPLLFTLYSSPVAVIARKHNLGVQLYADESILYLAFKTLDTSRAVRNIEQCVDEIRVWMTGHKLKLNQDKTIIFQLTRRNEDIFVGTFSFSGADVPVTPIARNLRVLYDSQLNMKAHISQICRASYLHISNISAIRKMLTREAAETLVHAFITSRLDYCNSLLYGLPDTTLRKLQLIQNHVARVVTGTRKYDRITPVLHQLHWLPMSQRIIYKLLKLTYQAVHGMGPVYLCELAVPYRPGRALRSADDPTRLAVPRTRGKYGDRSFAVAGPSLWNDLPRSLREADSVLAFKAQLKTLLFQRTYGQ